MGLDADGWLGGRAFWDWHACWGSSACRDPHACRGSRACWSSSACRGPRACLGAVACRGSRACLGAVACLGPRTCLATPATYLGVHVSLRTRVCLCTPICLCTPVYGAPTPAPSRTPRSSQPRPHSPREGRAQGLRETQHPRSLCASSTARTASWYGAAACTTGSPGGSGLGRTRPGAPPHRAAPQRAQSAVRGRPQPPHSAGSTRSPRSCNHPRMSTTVPRGARGGHPCG